MSELKWGCPFLPPKHQGVVQSIGPLIEQQNIGRIRSDLP